MKLASGIILMAKTKMFERIFVISDPVEIHKMNTGFRATMMMMDDFEVSDPPKNVVIANMDRNLADIEVESRTASVADVKITICDELNQPYYTIEKYNVPYEGFITSEFGIRGDLKAVKTSYMIIDPNNKTRQ